MDASGLVRVWADMATAAKCKWCQRAIVWRITFQKGSKVPFNAAGTSYGIEKDDNGRKIETLAWTDRHDCPERPKNLKKKPQRWAPVPPQRSFF